MENKKSNAPICMAEKFWVNSHLSVARHCGGIKAFGHEYKIVNKHGISLFELSDPTGKYYVGDENKAIEPGEPADLCRVDWIPIYKALGREAFLEYLKENRTLEEAKKYVKELKGGKK